MKTPTIDQLNALGRPLMRLTGMAICVSIGLAFAVAFWAWALFQVQLPPLPGEALALGLIPYAYQAWDNWVRSHQKNTETAFMGAPRALV